MKKMIILLAAGLMMTAYSCKKIFDSSPKLPSETQTGKHTFGCYVNGELFVPSWGAAGFGAPSLRANYWKSSNRLTIGAYAKNDFLILRMNPEENNKKISAWVEYNDRIRHYENTGEVILTHFDLDNLVVSGTFACDIPKSDGTVIRITQGRFDIKMEDYNIRE